MKDRTLIPAIILVLILLIYCINSKFSEYEQSNEDMARQLRVIESKLEGLD